MANGTRKARSRRAHELAAAARANDLSAALATQIGQCAARANDQAQRLQCIGDQAFDVVGDISRRATTGELLQRSNAMRGLVAHALAVLVEIQLEAGRLDAIAALREIDAETRAIAAHGGG